MKDLKLPTPAEAERLDMLAEECAEVITLCSKIKRFGYDNHHPNDKTKTNRNLLLEEMKDVLSVLRVGMADEIGMVFPLFSRDELKQRWKEKLAWTSKQDAPKPPRIQIVKEANSERAVGSIKQDEDGCWTCWVPETSDAAPITLNGEIVRTDNFDSAVEIVRAMAKRG